jgi:hypothetical protein
MTDCIAKARIKEVAHLPPIRLPSPQPRIYDTADEARGGGFIWAEAMRGKSSNPRPTDQDAVKRNDPRRDENENSRASVSA